MARTVRSLVLLLALSACIPDLADDVEPTALPTAHPDVRTGGTLRVAFPATDTLDPGLVTYERSVAGVLCDQLIMQDPVTGELRPALARSWTLTDSGRRLFVRLRPGARFHDGTPVTADDVVFTLTRLASRDFASPAASLLAPIAGFGQIHGDIRVDELPTRLSGVRAADETTVEIEFAEPFADFTAVLTHPATSPVPRAAASAPGFERAPVCAGPYRLARPFTPGGRVVLERFAGYHGANTAFTRGGAGYADRIVFEPAVSRAAEVRLFERGRVDVSRAPLTGSPGRHARARDTSSTEFLGFPTSVAPFDDPAVRWALVSAIDLEPLTAPTEGRRTRSPRRFAGQPAGDRTPAALDALDVIRLYVNDDGANVAAARSIARDWRDEFGVRVRVITTTFEAFLARGRSTSGFDGPFRFGWAPMFGSPEAFQVPLFDDSGIGRDNLSRFDDATFADLLRTARRTVDATERAAAWVGLIRRVEQQAPMAPLWVDVRWLLIRDGVIRSAIDALQEPLLGDPILRELSLEG